ncbi:MAG: hypothetical protein NT091_02890, partial [Candidatus Falkowbacteria bacterium]|nr:hypothetical protein [Candidatus Falkowbacteria bacterium]
NTAATTTPPATIVVDKFSPEATSIINKKIVKKDVKLESKIVNLYIKPLIKNIKNANATTIQSATNFIAYGTLSTKNISASERAGVLSSYKRAFNKLPATQKNWTDILRIANGQVPEEANIVMIKLAKDEFKKIYKHDANLENKNDNKAIMIIAYGLRPTTKDTVAETAAIQSFKLIYKYNPVTTLDLNIMRAIAYSGAKRQFK